MQRRTFVQSALGAAVVGPLLANVQQHKFDAAAKLLETTTASGQVSGATLYLRRGKLELAKAFGTAKSVDAMFLLGSISKPISVAAVMTLVDQWKLRLDDLAKKYLPEFTADGRERITIRQLLTHVSGLPDQLPENQQLRSSQAGLAKFVEAVVRTPLLFPPGARYEYSSMAILLAAEIAQRISGTNFLKLVDQTVFEPLGMKHSAIGLGRFKLDDFMRCQTEHAAPEAGAGDAQAKQWDWNSPYWRKLGAPWGGVHASAPDVARFLGEFLRPTGKLLKPETCRLMVTNHNPEGLTPRGLGFAVGARSGSPGCSEQCFGHTGSTGTLAWADPESDTICVVLTTLPARAVDPHPYRLVSDLVAKKD